MNFNFQTHTSIAQLPNVTFPVYFAREYLNSQQHQNLIGYESSKFYLPCILIDRFAISIPKSPFGSFLIKEKASSDEVFSFFESIKNDLNQRNIKELVITHPPKIYKDFDDSSFEEMGFQAVYHDINQHIILSNSWEEKIHNMQKRKLQTLNNEGFEFSAIPLGELETIHRFITVCRQTQGLKINISLELIKKLSLEIKAFDLFGVFRDGKISAACITVRVSDEVVYYYLPATSPLFRSQSPMVLLLKGMVGHYHKEGYKYLDLGISSVEGRPQDTLRIFKERMGANETRKTRWKLFL